MNGAKIMLLNWPTVAGFSTGVQMFFTESGVKDRSILVDEKL